MPPQRCGEGVLAYAVILSSLTQGTTGEDVSGLVVFPPPQTLSRGMQGELDELEREEFFRLKKVQAKKKRDMDAKEAEQAAANAVSVAAYEAPSLLDENKDDDLLF